MTDPLVLHLNGPPGVGKSTLARRWADEHPGTLLLDIDALRTWFSGWRDDFASAGAAIRPVALAMISAYAGQGGDVVLPQLLADEDELARFEHAATSAGARFVEVFLEADREVLADRFGARSTDEPHLEVVHRFVADAGPGHLEDFFRRLTALADRRPGAIRLPTGTHGLDATYLALVEAVDGR